MVCRVRVDVASSPLLTLTTNCHIAQDIRLHLTGIGPALPPSLWLPPLSLEASLHGVLCRAVLCRAARFTCTSAARFLVFLACAYRHNSFDLLTAAGRHSASFSPSSRLGRRPRLRLRLVRLVSSFRLEGFSFSLGLRRLSKICNNSCMGAAIVFVFLFSVGILGILSILAILCFYVVLFLHILCRGAAWVA